MKGSAQDLHMCAQSTDNLVSRHKASAWDVLGYIARPPKVALSDKEPRVIPVSVQIWRGSEAG